jgi:hypothetical protein
MKTYQSNSWYQMQRPKFPGREEYPTKSLANLRERVRVQIGDYAGT